jgi:hypothetical protein
MLKHVMLSRVVPVNEEVNVVKPVPKEGQSPVEVGLDIYGTNPEAEIPIDQGKPQMHTTPPCVLQSYITYVNAWWH